MIVIAATATATATAAAAHAHVHGQAHLVGFAALLVLFHLHASILEPDLDLTLGEVQHGGELDAARSTQVAREVELLLELDELRARVGRASAL